MTLYEYNLLDPDTKSQVLWDKGTFIMTRIENPYRINLYSLFDFFAEAWYNDDANSIDKIRTFKSINALEPYLSKIKLNLKP